jgi:hypothetical protein
MEISIGLAEALARFAYVQSHQAEVSEADWQKATRELTARVREEERLISMLRSGATAGTRWADVNVSATESLFADGTCRPVLTRMLL